MNKIVLIVYYLFFIYKKKKLLTEQLINNLDKTISVVSYVTLKLLTVMLAQIFILAHNVHLIMF